MHEPSNAIRCPGTARRRSSTPTRACRSRSSDNYYWSDLALICRPLRLCHSEKCVPCDPTILASKKCEEMHCQSHVRVEPPPTIGRSPRRPMRQLRNDNHQIVLDCADAGSCPRLCSAAGQRTRRNRWARSAAFPVARTAETDTARVFRP